MAVGESGGQGSPGRNLWSVLPVEAGQGAGDPPTWPGAQWGLGLQFRAMGRRMEAGGGRSVVSTDQSPFRKVLGPMSNSAVTTGLPEVPAEF